MIGTKETYNFSRDRVLEAARQAVTAMGLTITSSSDNEVARRFEASTPVDGPIQWKNVMVVAFKDGERRTRLMVASTRTRPRADVEQTALTNEVFARVKRILEQK